MFSIGTRRLIPCLAFSALALASGVSVAGPKAYVGNFKDNTVSVIDTGNHKVVATIPVAAGPHGMTITPDGLRVYLTGDESSSLNVIDTGTDKVVRTVEVGKAPHGVALAPDAKLLLVAINGEDQVAFFDTAKQAVVGKVRVLKPHTIAISRDGKLAYVSSQEPGKYALAVVDLGSRSVARTIPLDKPPRDVEFGSDGKAVYFTTAGINAVQVLDPASNSLVASIPTGASPHYANFFPHMALGMAVIQGPGEVMFFDPSSNTAVRSIKVGKQPHWLAASSDGKTAFVTDEGSNDLSIIDLSTGKIDTIAVGNAPRKVAVQPAPAAKVSMSDCSFVPVAAGQGNAPQKAAVQPALAKVSISNFAFVPNVIEVTAGQAITWSNDDGAPHAVTYRDGSAGARSLSPGETFTRVFDRPGSYDYFCSFHPFMSGRVVVRPA